VSYAEELSRVMSFCATSLLQRRRTLPTNAQVKHYQEALQDSSKSVKRNVIDYHINYYEFKYEKEFSSTDLKIDNLKKYLSFWEIR